MLLRLVFLLFGGCESLQQRFLEEPGDITVMAGQRVELPCLVEHKEGLLQWTKDGFGLGVSRDLPGYPSYFMVGGDPVQEWTLVLEKVGLGEDGVFQCQVGASGSSNPIRSAPAQVTVLVPPGQPLLVHGENIDGVEGVEELVVDAEEGGDLVVTCVSKGGRPAGEVTWRDEWGDPVAADTQTKTVKMEDKSWHTVSVLRLRVGLEDRDRKLVCHVSTHINQQVKEAVARVRLSYRPRVSFGKVRPVREGGNLAVTCGVEAYPPAEMFVWYFDGVLIPGAGEDSLLLEEITRTNEGSKVECEATNSEGSGRSSTFLSVHYGAEIVRGPETVKVRQGEQASLYCKAIGNPSPTYSWVRLGSSHSIGKTETLTLVASSISQGQYRCQAMVEGFPMVSSPPASVLLVTKPLILSPEHQTGVLGSSSRLVCRVASAGRNNLITWENKGSVLSGQEPGIQMIFTETEEEQMSELIIQSTTEEHLGSYGCKAANEVGVDFKVITLSQEGSSMGISSIIYIVLGLFILATLGLMAVLCFVLYQRRKRSNLKYLRSAKQEQEARDRIEDCPEDVKDWVRNEGQLSSVQPDLIQPLPRTELPNIPRSFPSDLPESDDDLPIMQEFESRIYNPPKRRPFAIDRFMQHKSEPSSSPMITMTAKSSNSQCGEGIQDGLEDEEEDEQFLTLLPDKRCVPV